MSDLLRGGVPVERGSVFDPLPTSPGLVVLPAHCVIRDDGCLVAPSGVLHESKLIFGGDVSKHLGHVVKTENVNACYGFKVIYDPHRSGVGLALFQTQYGWWEPPKKHLAAQSMAAFDGWLQSQRNSLQEPVAIRVSAQPGVDWGMLRALDKATRRRITLVQRTRRPEARDGFIATEAPGAA